MYDLKKERYFPKYFKRQKLVYVLTKKNVQDIHEQSSNYFQRPP